MFYYDIAGFSREDVELNFYEGTINGKVTCTEMLKGVGGW